MGARSGRRLALGLLAGLACFALGLGAARLLGPASPPQAPAEPRIVIDEGTLRLLPDASLHLDLSPEFDAAVPVPAPR